MGDPADVDLAVVLRPALLMSWFHYLLTEPFLASGAREFPCSWGSQRLLVPAGDQELRVFFRYRLMRRAGPRLCEAIVRLTLQPEEGLALHAYLPASNQKAFRIRVG
ncbi:MAG: hypothetical protein ACRDPG_03115 [Nocardioidaceae bacterium]